MIFLTLYTFTYIYSLTHGRRCAISAVVAAALCEAGVGGLAERAMRDTRDTVINIKEAFES